MCDSDGPAWVEGGGDGASALQVTGLNQASIWAEGLGLQRGQGLGLEGAGCSAYPHVCFVPGLRPQLFVTVTTQAGGPFCYPHFAVEETEAQRC